MNELLEKLENNSFIDKVRMDLEFDVKEYQELLKILNVIIFAKQFSPIKCNEFFFKIQYLSERCF